MAIVVRELHPVVETGACENGLTTQRHFVVYDDTTQANISKASQVIAIFGNGTMPNYGEVHPHLPTLVAIDYTNLAPMPGSVYIWRITWNYLQTSGVGPISPGMPGYWEYNYRTQVEIVPSWRNKPSPNSPFAAQPLIFPTNGIPTWTSSRPDSCGGEPIDSCGEPGDAIVLQQVVDITEHVAGLYTPANSFSFMKRRNNVTFLGAAAGRLLYAGIAASGRLAPNIFSITHSLVWDEWYHMRQRPSRGPTGEIYKRAIGGALIDVAWVAEHVYWHQPFIDLANFDNISTRWP